MRLTNNYGYPSCIVAMAKASLSRPVDGIIRVTSLIGPTAIRYYQLHNWDDIVVDVDEFIQSGFGTAWHRYLASFASSIPELYSEQTLQIEDDGIVISGTPDIRLVDAIEDIKVTSAWSFVFAKPEWEAQLNTYALLASANGFPISSLRINAFLRDWSALNYMRYKPNYPERPFYCQTLPLWSLERRKEYVNERVKDHQAGLRPCTPEERWQKETTWAVMKKGVQKAQRVLNSKAAAYDWIASKNSCNSFTVQERPGSCRRCEDYCFVRSVCQYRST